MSLLRSRMCSLLLFYYIARVLKKKSNIVRISEQLCMHSCVHFACAPRRYFGSRGIFFKPRFYEILTWRWIVKIWTRVVWSPTKPVAAKVMRGCWDLGAQCESHVVCGICEILLASQGLPLFLSSRQQSELCPGM